MGNKILISIGGILILLIIFIFVYSLIKYEKKKRSFKIGYEYISEGKNIDDNNKYENKVFDKHTSNVNDCIEYCKESNSCSGITYNNNNNNCIGLSKGILQESDSKYYAWEKQKHNRSFNDKIIINNEILFNKEIEINKIMQPVYPGKYLFSFWLKIPEWYGKSIDSWKHIMHIGPEQVENTNFNTENDIKEQNLNLSIWLKPHKNIMTLFFNTSLSNINNDSKNIEHIDIDNIPINKLFFMAINVNDNIIEIYINGQLSQVNTLDKNHMLSHNYENKIHIFNNNDSFFESYMYNLSYLQIGRAHV